MKSKLRFKFIGFLMIVGSLTVMGQDSHFKWQSALHGVYSPGYYKILLSPDVKALCEDNGSDLRLLDSVGNFVPYLLRVESPLSLEKSLYVLPFRVTTDTGTESIEIINNQLLLLSEVILTLKNKAQNTVVQLTGSDEGTQWFDISKDIILAGSHEMNADTFDQVFHFPSVKYKLLRLTVNLHKSVPLNLLKASVARSTFTDGKYSLVPPPDLQQKDSAKCSFVTLDYTHAYSLEKLKLVISGPRFYHRNVEIFYRDTLSWINAGNGYISSTGSNELALSCRARHLLLIVHNEDDIALRIDSVQAFQLNSFLLTYLEADRNHFLVFGNAKAARPNYDLSYFEDSIRKNELIEITCDVITGNKIIPGDAPAKKVTKGLTNWWLWPVLSSVLLLLLYFTVKIAQDVNRKD